MDRPGDGLIEPTWTLVFCKTPGRWWVRLLAWGRYHHVKAVAYLPRLRAWVFYDVRFNGTRVLLAHADAPGTSAFVQDYLDNCDTIVMPRVPIPIGIGRNPHRHICSQREPRPDVPYATGLTRQSCEGWEGACWRAATSLAPAMLAAGQRC